MAKDRNTSDSSEAQNGPATLDMPSGDPVVLERPTPPAAPEAGDSGEAYDGKPVAVWEPLVPGIERRKITAKDYERLGGTKFDDLVFEPENDYTVLLEGVPNAVVDLLRKEPRMTIKGA